MNIQNFSNITTYVLIFSLCFDGHQFEECKHCSVYVQLVCQLHCSCRPGVRRTAASAPHNLNFPHAAPGDIALHTPCLILFLHQQES